MNPVDQAEALIRDPQKRHVHMLGIGGIGMAGLARLLQQRGCDVSGCDAQANRQTQWLESHGVSVSIGHDAAHISSEIDWVIRTTAVPDSHPEVIAAKEQRIPVLRRGEVLPALLRGRRTIAVSGTHGKTTTSSLIAQVLRFCGVDCGWCIGGEVPGLDGVAGDGPVMVVEADESDGTAALYSPEIAVITNIEYDHMEHHASEESFVDVFRSFAAQSEKVIYCAEDRIASEVCQSLEKSGGYRLDAECVIPDFALPGRHNLLNAQAVRSVASALGVDDDPVLQALGRVKAPLRRFEVISQERGITVVSDYAHHPTEIRCLIESAQSYHPQRILALFQPHRYTRTLALGADFPPAFEGVNELWLAPVYAASESPIAGGTTEDLCGRFSAEWRHRLHYVTSLEQAWGEIQRQLRPGDLFLIIGAGDVVKVADWVKEDL
ncbi:UDP-N-acetylmuramate--L-alanine ligase [Verrucomicrobiota bacterium]